MADTSAPDSTDLVRITRVDSNSVGTPGAVDVNDLFNTSGVGYSSGGAVTQITNRTTGVTLNTLAGAITLISAAGVGIATPASFTVTNSAVAATDTIIVNQKSGTDLYAIHVTAVAAGSFRITSWTTGGTTTESPVFNFAVIKGAAA